MTAWSLTNVNAADDVEALLDKASYIKAEADGRPGPAMSRETARAVIHAALWAYGTREGSTGSGYAYSNLCNALGLKSWTFEAPTPPSTVVPGVGK